MTSHSADSVAWGKAVQEIEASGDWIVVSRRGNERLRAWLDTTNGWPPVEFMRHSNDTGEMNEYKTGGPNVEYVIGTVRCCRVWPVVTATLTWTEGIDGWKRESWWWRRCGLCGVQPILVQENRS